MPRTSLLAVWLGAVAAPPAACAAQEPIQPVLRELRELIGTEVQGAAVANLEIELGGTGEIESFALNAPGRNALVAIDADALAYLEQAGAFRLVSGQRLDVRSLPAAGLPRLSPARGEGAPKAATGAPSSFAATSAIGLPVFAAGDALGTVERLAFELTSGVVAFAGVSAGASPDQRGDLLWIPWSACELAVCRGRHGAWNAWLEVPLAERKLAGAPRATVGELEDPRLRGRLYELFRVPAPAFERR